MNGRLVISRLGAQGDGVADTPEGPVFVPYALPGETVTVARERNRAVLLSVVQPSDLRAVPPCRHFTECGGCALQHLCPSAYLAWKRERVVDALAARRIEAPVGETVACEPASRRRAVFSARRGDRGVILGYNRALSHDIVDIAECPILVPAIVAALPLLRHLAGIVAATRDSFHLTVTQTDSGLDVAAEGSGTPSEAARRAAADLVVREGLARLSVDGEIIVEPVRPAVTFGPASVVPPPGAFLQAVASAEEAMARLVSGHLGKAKRIADLFSGSGTFALRLAARSEVHAIETDAAALSALDRGFRFASGLRQVSTERRDLFRRPLTLKELNLYDGIIFDPPRAGAEDQAKQIARSDVPRVAAVSCNPVTLARDLAVLVDGGYRIVSVTPVDQFLWSPHVEAVALLEKPKRRR
ncbi:MAG TPA: class I SAM-dependent RNA methyltransferase [Rhizobiales bacterium]|nr:class I SAM-dependent RNA methyltransferase [Hyphomicrobiales bacterium]